MGVPLLRGALALRVCLVPRIRSSVWRIFSSTGWLCTVAALCIAVVSIYTSSDGTAASCSSAARGVLLYAPVVLRRHLFCSLASGARALFNSTLPPGPRPQIWEPYSIIGLTTAVYSRRVSLKEGPYIKVVIRNAAKNTAAPLWVACVIYSFQFSLEST